MILRIQSAQNQRRPWRNYLKNTTYFEELNTYSSFDQTEMETSGILMSLPVEHGSLREEDSKVWAILSLQHKNVVEEESGKIGKQRKKGPKRKKMIHSASEIRPTSLFWKLVEA